jgi:two-component system response regulator HupR/HoxA
MPFGKLNCMEPSGTVLIVAQVGSAWSATADLLVDEYGYRVLAARTHAEAKSALADFHVDLIIAEESSGGFLAEIRVSYPEVMRILALDKDSSIAVDTIQSSAIYQFVRKPLDAVQIGLMVKRGLEARELARRHRLLAREFKVSGHSDLLHDRHEPALRLESQRFEKLIFVSEKMAELCDLARRAARTELPILIEGETGTGKELLARAIHFNSARRASPLMVQNCGGLPDDLLQSELFGHKRGAFTGAISDRLGLFRAADGGTVFLDEIDSVSSAFQVSLLRFLQEGEVKPLGSDKTSFANVRIIAAANQPIRDLVAAGAFRQDLYFRLRGFELETPPLRERAEDIGALAEFFSAKHSTAIGRKILGISAAALDKLTAFDFPGNVRELENEVRRMVALARDGEYLTTQNMSPALLAATARRPLQISGYAPEGATLRDKVENLEKRVVGETLRRVRWNQSRAADELGLSRVGLANKIKRYGLDEPS